MKKIILNRSGFWLLCLTLLLVSCSKEQLTDDSDGTTSKLVELRLQVDAPMGGYISDNENSINHLRMVVFGSIGSPDAGKLILNKYYATAPQGNMLKEVITSGKRDIYIIVNEPLSGGGEQLDSYATIVTVSDVRNLSLVYQGAGSVGVYTPDEIPMFIEHSNQLIRHDVQNEIGGAVERTMAKVTLKLNVKNSNFPTGKQVVIDHIIIRNLPERSYLIARNYADALVASEKQNVAIVTPAAGYNFSSNNIFYVPEYLFNNPEKGAFIEITGHVNGEPTKIAKWNVKLGDAMDDAGLYGDRYHITRNRHYIFTGDVKSYGLMDFEVKVTVLPWNTVNQNEDVGLYYITYNKVTDATDGVIADGSNVDDMGTTLKVVCNTNIGGWYTVTRDMNNKIVHKSSSTASVSSATLQTVNITIPKLAELTYGQNYTISVYHQTLAQESIGPVKSLNFVQKGGFIPNSILIAANWPADKLPPTGLQLAKRGKNVLPSGIAEKEDMFMSWKQTNTATPGTAPELGMGVSSTAAMAGVEHLAAQYCRDMGKGWFLPSIKELELIHKNKNALGSSYGFVPYEYWSATEFSPINSWYVNFFYGYTKNTYKGSNCRVRCVRGI